MCVYNSKCICVCFTIPRVYMCVYNSKCICVFYNSKCICVFYKSNGKKE